MFLRSTRTLSRNMSYTIHICPLFSDNYSYFLIDSATKETAVVDPAEPEKIIAKFNQLKQSDSLLKLSAIFTTHKHWYDFLKFLIKYRDHASGNESLRKQFPQIKVYGSSQDAIPAMTHPVTDNDSFQLGALQIRTFFSPCHTKGHVLYFVADDTQPALFSGDTFFLAGCGRFFEGSAQEMYSNVQKMKSLPQNTLMYCGHEYSVKNLLFAQSIASNEHVTAKLQWCQEQAQKGLPTIPSTIKEEFLYNPFFRVDEQSVQQAVGAIHDPVETMKRVRAAKDKF